MRKTTFICFLCGPVLALLFFAGFVLLADFLPPPAPTLTPAEVAAVYQAHPIQTLIGTFLIMTAMGMIAPWGAALAARLRSADGELPVLTYVQLVNCAVATMVVVFCPMFWAAAAYRSFDSSPEIIRVMNDIAWFLVLAPWPPFTFWLIAVALSIFADKRPQPDFPRWLGFFGIWAGVLFIPAGGVLVFKTGPFAWNGLLAFYIPVIAFFLWLVIMSYYGMRAARR